MTARLGLMLGWLALGLALAASPAQAERLVGEVGEVCVESLEHLGVAMEGDVHVAL